MVHIQGSTEESNLWPDLPKRHERSGGYFSQWLGEYLKTLPLSHDLDFHCFRHTVRTQLALKDKLEIAIDRLLGHSHIGSIGARTYTQITTALPKIVSAISYEFEKILPFEASILRGESLVLVWLANLRGSP